MHNLLTINYVIAIDEQDEILPLYGFTPGIIDACSTLHSVLKMPPNLHHLGDSRNTHAKYRILGEAKFAVLPLQIDALHQLKIYEHQPLFCIIHKVHAKRRVEHELGKVKVPILIISDEDLSLLANDAGAARACIIQHATKVAAYYESKEPKLAEVILKHLGNPKESDEIVVIEDIKEFNHGVTLANEVALQLAGFSFRHSVALQSILDSDYLDAIVGSCAILADKRKLFCHELAPKLQPPTCDLVLACPAPLYHLRSMNAISDSFRESPAELRRSLKMFLRQDSYAPIATKEELHPLLSHPAFAFVSELKTKEMSAFNTVSTLQAVTEFCPVFRLPGKLNDTRQKLSQLGDVKRGKSSNEGIKSQRLAQSIREEVTRGIPKELENFVSGYDKHIRIAADAPIELYTPGELPLSLRHFTSRYPVTPGNLYLNQAVSSANVFIDLDKLSEIPIIRSFQPSDPIAPMMESYFERFKSVDKWCFIPRIYDVKSRSELIDTLNSIDAPFVVFDCHGSHTRDLQIGRLRIGTEDVDVWTLRGKVRIPPIVISSCCDACPDDRSHATITNGFLTLGAKTVYGPIFPVSGSGAAKLIARIFYRLGIFAREWLDRRRVPLSWMRVVGAEMRATFLDDCLDGFCSQNWLSNKQRMEVFDTALSAINQYYPNWFDVFIDAAQETSRVGKPRLLNFVKNSCPYPEVLSYVQYGNPEKVIFMHRDK